MDIKKVLKRTFLPLGVYGLIRKLAPNRKIAILRYHAIVEPDQNFYASPGIALSPAEFEKQVRYFTARYHVISLDEAVRMLAGETDIIPNSVVFTFDDGYKDNLTAARILHRYHATGTFYITAEPIARTSPFWLTEVTVYLLKAKKSHLSITTVGETFHFELGDTSSRWRAIREIVRLIKSNDRSVRETVLEQIRKQLATPELEKEIRELMLSVDDVKEMLHLGMSIASHTLTHLNLPNARPEDAVREVAESKTYLEKLFGVKINHFSYPNSGPYAYFNERVRQYAVEAGYQSATTSNQGFAGPASDRFALERIRTDRFLEEVVFSMEWDRLLSN